MKEIALVCAKGNRGQLKASKLEFEIVDTTSVTSTIRIKPWNTKVEVADSDLRQIAVGIE